MTSESLVYIDEYGPAKEETQGYDVGCFQSICGFFFNLRLCNIQAGDVVVDPMAGGGSIPIEVRDAQCDLLINRDFKEFYFYNVRQTYELKLKKLSRLGFFFVCTHDFFFKIQASCNWRDAVHLSGDIDDRCYERTQLNIADFNKHRMETDRQTISVDIFRWDVTRLPLRTSSVDVFISDLVITLINFQIFNTGWTGFSMSLPSKHQTQHKTTSLIE